MNTNQLVHMVKGNSVLRNSWHTLRFMQGYLAFQATNSTSTKAYGSMRNLYCATNGRLNDALRAVEGVFRPAYKLPSNAGILGNLSEAQVQGVVEGIRRDGFYIFDQKLSPE